MRSKAICWPQPHSQSWRKSNAARSSAPRPPAIPILRGTALKQPVAEHEEDPRRGSLAAPMPGKIVQVMSSPGDQVKKGQPLLILEAMKMEHTITAPADGVVKEVHFAAGEQVLEGAELITLE